MYATTMAASLMSRPLLRKSYRLSRAQNLMALRLLHSSRPFANVSSIIREVVQDILPVEYLQPRAPVTPRSKRTLSREHYAATLRMLAAAHQHQQAELRLASATVSKHEQSVHEPRTFLIHRLIGLSRVLSAMTAFTEDINDPTRKMYSIEDYELIMQALRARSKLKDMRPPSHIMTKAKSSEKLWHPSCLNPDIKMQNLPVTMQCLYAMATVYDACVKQGIPVTAKLVSPILATLLNHAAPSHLLLAAQTALKDLSAGSHGIRGLSHHVLSSFLLIFGRAQKPELGEELLNEWALQQSQPLERHVRTESSDTSARGGQTAGLTETGICLTGWSHSIILWTSLIHGRINANDLRGARAWLERFRVEALPAISSHDARPFPPRQAASPDRAASSTTNSPQKPYLAYMTGLRNAHKIKDECSTPYFVLKELRTILESMQHDGIRVDDQVLSFMLDLSLSQGQVNESMKMLSEVLPIDTNTLHLRPVLLQILFRLRSAVASLDMSMSESQNQLLPSTRALVAQLIQGGEDSSVYPTKSPCRRLGLLNDALKASLAERDYPAAIVVLNTLETWLLQPSDETCVIIVTSLLREGHQDCFVLPEILSNSVPRDHEKTNKHNILHGIASIETNDNMTQAERRLQILRRAHKRVDARTEANTSTSSHVRTSTPQRPFRGYSVKWLANLLTSACIHSVQKNRSKITPLKWMPTPSTMPQALYLRMQGALETAAQDLIGPYQRRASCVLTSEAKRSKARQQGTGSNEQAEKREIKWSQAYQRETKAGINLALLPLHRKPALNQFPVQRRTWQPQSATQFASGALSASATQSTTAASCKLAESNHSSESEPVRIQYLPGFVPYKLGLALQEFLVSQRAEARSALRIAAQTHSTSAGVASGFHKIEPSRSEAELRKIANQDTLLLLQHRPVYTEGRREENENEVMSQHLRSLGADYSLTKRGGQITYHGPGQLVGYPILDLGAMNLSSRCYVDRVQDMLIGALAEQRITTVPPPEDHTGVWVDEYHKIASIGIQVRHRISSHGFALNVESRSMRGFEHITACGIVGRNMTCIADVASATARTPKRTASLAASMTVPDAAIRVTRHFARIFRRQTRPATPSEFQFTLASEDQAATLASKLKIPISHDEQVITHITVDGKPVLVP